MNNEQLAINNEKNFDRFASLGADSFFVSRLGERGIIKPTDIQCRIMPCISAGEDIFFGSATGTGKTFAYLLPVLGKLLEQRSKEEPVNVKNLSAGAKPFALIIAPTLELCTQIKSELDFLLYQKDKSDPLAGIHSSLIIGSVSIDRQIDALKKHRQDIIVGNPGRLLSLARTKKINFSALKYLILDEADRLVSDEMIEETNELCKIIHRCACKPVFAACSATLNIKAREKLLAACRGKHQADPIKYIESEDNEILYEKIEHWAIFSEKRRKDQTLRSLLAALNGGKKNKVKALIFTSRNDEALFLLSRLQHHKVPAAGLFGKVSKKPISGEARKTALDSFRDGKVIALVSTDLAARGLDINGITHVIALDVPSSGEAYIHRCGRTGRAGKRGVMVTIGDETQMHLLAAMEKKLRIKVFPKELHYGRVCAPAPIEPVPNEV